MSNHPSVADATGDVAAAVIRMAGDCGAGKAARAARVAADTLIDLARSLERTNREATGTWIIKDKS